MGFTYDNGIVLPNNKTDGGQTSVPTEAVASDWNLHCNATTDLRSAIQGGNYHGMRDMSGGMPSLAPSGNVLIASKSGRLFHSQNGTAWEGIGRTSVEKEWTYFGIVGDGVTDDTAAFRDALEFFGASGGPFTTGRLILPPGSTILLTGMCEYFGSASYTFIMEAKSSGANQAGTGCQLKWGGSAPTDRPMVRIVGANGFVARNLQFNGNSRAQHMLAIDNATVNGGGVMYGPSSWTLVERCAFFDNGGSGCSGIRIGGATNTQVSEVFIDWCHFIGRTSGASAPGYGVYVTTVANCKNFRVTRSAFNFNNVHAAMGGSGVAKLMGCNFGQATGAFVTGGANCLIANCEAESGTNAGGLGACFVYDGGEPANSLVGASLTLQNNYFSLDTPAAGVTYPLGGGIPTTQNDDIAIRAPAKTVVIANDFVSFKPAFTFFKACIGASGAWRGVPYGQGGSFVSVGNWYQDASDSVPVYDTNGNRLTGSGAGSYGNVTQQSIVSVGDMGGSSTTPYALEPLFGRPPSAPIFQPIASDVVSKIVYAGQNRRPRSKWTLSYTDFQVAATTKNIKVATLPAGSYLKKVQLNVTTAFSGTAGTLVMRCGIGSGDTKVFSDTDVKSAPILIGDASADYTAGAGNMGAADALALGFCPNQASNFDLYIRLTSGSGNLSGLSAGVVTISIEVEVP